MSVYSFSEKGKKDSQNLSYVWNFFIENERVLKMNTHFEKELHFENKRSFQNQMITKEVKTNLTPPYKRAGKKELILKISDF